MERGEGGGKSRPIHEPERFFFLPRKLNRPSFNDRGSKADTSVFTTL